MKGRATPEMIEYLSKTLKEKYKVTVKVVETGEVCEYVGERYHEYEDYTEVEVEEEEFPLGTTKETVAR